MTQALTQTVVTQRGGTIRIKQIKGIEYISLTDIAKDFQHRLDTYLESPQLLKIKGVLAKLPEFLGVKSVITQEGRGGGTWAVEEIAQHYMQQVDPEYAILVGRLLKKIRKGEVEIVPVPKTLPPTPAHILRPVSRAMSLWYHEKLKADSGGNDTRWLYVNANKKAMKIATRGTFTPGQLEAFAKKHGLKPESGVDALFQLAPIPSARLSEAKAYYALGIAETMEEAYALTEPDKKIFTKLVAQGLGPALYKLYTQKRDPLILDEPQGEATA